MHEQTKQTAEYKGWVGVDRRDKLHQAYHKLLTLLKGDNMQEYSEIQERFFSGDTKIVSAERVAKEFPVVETWNIEEIQDKSCTLKGLYIFKGDDFITELL